MIFIFPSEAEYRAQRWPLLTLGLLGSCAIVFLFQMGAWWSGSLEAFIRFFGLIPGEPRGWSWFTNIWVHGGMLHFLGNMAYLWIFGATVEDRLGRGMFAFLYLGAGLIGNAAQVGLSGSSAALIPIVGASGAIAGCMGAFLVLLPGTRIRLHYIGWIIVPFRGDWWVRAWTLLALWIGLNLLNAVVTWGDDVAGGTAYWCHIGGFAAGALMGFACRKSDAAPPARILDDQAMAGPFPVGAIREMVTTGSLGRNAMIEVADGQWEPVSEWVNRGRRMSARGMKGWLALAALAVLSMVGAWQGTIRATASGQIERAARGTTKGVPVDSRRLLTLSEKASGRAKAWGQWTGNLQRLVENEAAAASNAVWALSKARTEGFRTGWRSNSIIAYGEKALAASAALKSLENKIQALPDRFDEATRSLRFTPAQRDRERQRLANAVRLSMARLAAERDYAESIRAHCLVVEVYGGKFNRQSRRWEIRDPEGRQALQRAEANLQTKARTLEASR